MSSVGGFIQWTHHVESPLGEGPGEWDRLQLRCRSVRFGGKFLAADAPPDYVFGVVERRGPVETGAESFGDQDPAAGMVPARASVDVEGYGLAAFGCDAPLEDTRYTALVEIPVDYCEYFCTACDSPWFYRVLREFLAEHVSKERVRPYWLDEKDLDRKCG